MKRLLLILILGTLTALPANSQIWISFNWGDPDCGVCLNMEQALGLSYAQSLDYTQVVHEYGRRIQQAALRDYRYWDNSAREIYDLRMERDRIMQDILSPDQYYYYIDLIREDPGRIHDYAGWYTNPRYSRYTPSYLCFQYEDAYWHYHWYRNNGRWIGAFDNIFARPGSYQGRRYMSDPWRRDGYNDNYRNGKIYGSAGITITAVTTTTMAMHPATVAMDITPTTTDASVPTLTTVVSDQVPITDVTAITDTIPIAIATATETTDIMATATVMITSETAIPVTTTDVATATAASTTTTTTI